MAAPRTASRKKGRRPVPARRAQKRRRLVLLGGALLLGAAAAFGLARLDLIEETIREVTLPLRHDDIIRQQAAEKGVDADLIAAVIYAESRFQDQTSEAGARGLMQITPDTADTIERLSGGETFVYDDLADPDLNIRYGTYYLAYLLDRYDGNQVAALAAYHAGPTNADGWGGAELDVDEIPLEETHNYVEEVVSKREEYRDNYRDELGL